MSRPSKKFQHAPGGKTSISFGNDDSQMSERRSKIYKHAPGGKTSISFGGNDSPPPTEVKKPCNEKKHQQNKKQLNNDVDEIHTEDGIAVTVTTHEYKDVDDIPEGSPIVHEPKEIGQEEEIIISSVEYCCKICQQITNAKEFKPNPLPYDSSVEYWPIQSNIFSENHDHIINPFGTSTRNLFYGGGKNVTKQGGIKKETQQQQQEKTTALSYHDQRREKSLREAEQANSKNNERAEARVHKNRGGKKILNIAQQSHFTIG